MARKIYRVGNEFYRELQRREMKYTQRYVEAVRPQLSDKVKARITSRIDRILARFKKE
jgi:cyclopropane fatty-acyl-phospholipid synthase-like methyltransferase